MYAYVHVARMCTYHRIRPPLPLLPLPNNGVLLS